MIINININENRKKKIEVKTKIFQCFPSHAWVRDNLYAAHAIWAMYRAYQKSADFDEDLAKANELGLLWFDVFYLF